MRAADRMRRSSWSGIAAPDVAEDHRRELVGRDFRDLRETGRFRLVVAVLVVALVGGLLLAALRVDLIRMRYAMAEAMKEEQAAFALHRELTVALQERRDPARVAARARALGFVRPEQIIDLEAPPRPRVARRGTEPLP